MASSQGTPSEEPEDTTRHTSEAAEDTTVLLSHLRTDGLAKGADGVQALQKEGAHLGKGDKTEEAEADPDFRQRLRRRLVEEAEGGDAETGS